MPTLTVDHDFGRHKRGKFRNCPKCYPEAKAAQDALMAAASEPGDPVIASTGKRLSAAIAEPVAEPKPKRRVNGKAQAKARPAPALVADPEPLHPTREAWMLAAVEKMRPWYVEAGLQAVPDVSISIGWAGGRGSKKGVRGQCWASHTTANGIPAIFVTPDQSDPFTILGIILHEMNHASDDGLSGHKGTFAKQAAALGFVKPWTSSEGKTDELAERLKGLLADLGPFPHGAITDKSHGLTGQSPLAPPVQSTRMLKVFCEACGYTLRATKKWLEIAVPACPVDGDGMAVEW